jgi:outer membrane phospholipase A
MCTDALGMYSYADFLNFHFSFLQASRVVEREQEKSFKFQPVAQRKLFHFLIKDEYTLISFIVARC